MAILESIPPGFVRYGVGSSRGIVGWVVDPVTGCHIWVGGRERWGYAKLKVGPVSWLVHRLRYTREVGPIPEGMLLDHYVCSNGPGGCCNPHHCRPVTHWENSLRGNSVSSINLAKTHCKLGHPFDDYNTYRLQGSRICRRCKALREEVRRSATGARP